MEKLDLTKNNLKKFGTIMGIVFLTITLFIFIKHKHLILFTSLITSIFFIVAFFIPTLLKPAYIFWMKLAVVLSWINTRIILIIIFYLIFTPIGLIMKLFKVDLLDRKLDKSIDSYWKERKKEDFNMSNYERLF